LALSGEKDQKRERRSGATAQSQYIKWMFTCALCCSACLDDELRSMRRDLRW
jgi:hypothetical protein